MARTTYKRPTLQTSIVRQDGSTVTIADQIVELLRVGTPPEFAAAATGITAAEMRAWMAAGLAGMNRIRAGADWRREFTGEEQELVTFADRVGRAIGEWASRANTLLEQHMRGGQEQVTTRTKLVNGVAVEVHRTVEVTAPNAAVLMWRLERAFPQTYGRSGNRADLSPDLTDDDATVDLLLDRLGEIGERMEAIDVEEVGDADDQPQ